MSYLLDVNLLLACAWAGHAEHERANQWLNSVAKFATAPAVQMGFLRVSMSPAYSARYDDARAVLNSFLRLKGHRMVMDGVSAEALPPFLTSKDITDAHLVRIAMDNGLKLATLDTVLCTKAWAKGIAENPLRS